VIALLGLGASAGHHRVGRATAPAMATLDACLDGLDRLPGIRLQAASDRYRTRPWGQRPGGAYVNATALVRTDLPPLTLLARLLALEWALGRRRHRRRWTHRRLDIDLLFYGHRRIVSARLRVPHPWWRARPFVLVPAADLDAELPPAWRWPLHRARLRSRPYPLARPVRILAPNPDQERRCHRRPVNAL
jgi:2-amino-4-hydroxy-6-hydroxymethyldihydropteridine diphosphokinase